MSGIFAALICEIFYPVTKYEKKRGIYDEIRAGAVVYILEYRKMQN